MNGDIRNRRNWTRSLTIVMLVAAMSAFVGCMADKGAKKTDRIYLQNSAGAVLFDHGKHQNSTTSCAQCHHDLYRATPAASCEDCHDAGRAADEYSHAELKELHNRDCAKCHEQGAADAQAVSCRTCHATTATADTLTTSCSQCHEDSYSKEMMTHDEYTEIDEHSCLGCHAPRAVSEAYHTSCTSCHLETLPTRFATAGGDVSCGACHLR